MSEAKVLAASKSPDAAPDLRTYKCGWLSMETARRVNSSVTELRTFIRGLPKAELHLHVEGTFEPELLLKIARRNGENITLGGAGEMEWCKAQRQKRNFKNLQEFLDLYYSGCDVLKKEVDFYDLCMAYLKKASSNNILHVEMFFDPQTHMIERNNLPFDVVINGLHRACMDALKLKPPVDAKLIMSFLRHRHPGCAWAKPPSKAGEAMNLLKEALKHKTKFIAVGLDSSEKGNPPAIFKDIFALAREHGLRCVAHAGEEGPASYITDALDILKCERIDHGVRCLEDPMVVKRLARLGVPLTVCPCSNHRLQVNNRYFAGENPVRQLMDAGLKVTLNSDDPAFFFNHTDKFGNSYGGYISSNYESSAIECGLSADEIVSLAVNSFEASFITPKKLLIFKEAIKRYCESF